MKVKSIIYEVAFGLEHNVPCTVSLDYKLWAQG
jgi:hypothetical protein